jgi:hypothetical protein
MEIISGVDQKKRFSFDMEVHPYLRDHHLEGKAILPAVETLIIMARAVRMDCPQAAIHCLKNARFSRFLTITPDVQSLPVLVDIEKSENDGVTASLSTSIKTKTGNISREVEHARVEFSAASFNEVNPTPFRNINKLKGDCISVPSLTVYRELVPFGAAYQNIMGDLSISREGALAYVSGGDHETDETLLGSPFTLDAVMHAACVWGQRFAGIVAFPVGFDKRIIYQKTKKGAEYLGRVVPVSVNQDTLVFNAWIYKDDVMCETVSSLIMKDVTKGRRRPPEWIVNS